MTACSLRTGNVYGGGKRSRRDLLEAEFNARIPIAQLAEGILKEVSNVGE